MDDQQQIVKKINEYKEEQLVQKNQLQIMQEQPVIMSNEIFSKFFQLIEKKNDDDYASALGLLGTGTAMFLALCVLAQSMTIMFTIRRILS